MVTDHRALQYLLGARDVSGRLARWSLVIQQFDLTVVHRPGKAHINADALSRAPVDPAPFKLTASALVVLDRRSAQAAAAPSHDATQLQLWRQIPRSSCLQT